MGSYLWAAPDQVRGGAPRGGFNPLTNGELSVGDLSEADLSGADLTFQSPDQWGVICGLEVLPCHVKITVLVSIP